MLWKMLTHVHKWWDTLVLEHGSKGEEMAKKRGHSEVTWRWLRKNWTRPVSWLGAVQREELDRTLGMSSHPGSDAFGQGWSSLEPLYSMIERKRERWTERIGNTVPASDWGDLVGARLSRVDQTLGTSGHPWPNASGHDLALSGALWKRSDAKAQHVRSIFNKHMKWNSY
jgi:hypothetical protein